MKDSLLTKKVLLLAAICIVTFVCFNYTQYNQFSNWDDDFYVTNDPYIKEFTPHNLKVIFTEDITKNNYHPLCMLSLAVNYHFSQLDPRAYYLTNIFIHIANVILVFFLLLMLCKRLRVDEVEIKLPSGKNKSPSKGGAAAAIADSPSGMNSLFIAGFGALWFGIHPMRVESVSWLAERKDVLYAFFYFAGLMTYVRYTDGQKMKWYVATFFLFVASCLSKPMAVVFPFSMFCVDVLLQRQWSKKLIIEKLVFVAGSLVCGGAAIYTQGHTGAIASFSTLTLAERFMYASYGFIMYIWKLFSPTYLSTFYPYPYRYISGYLPTIYYAAPILSAAFVALPLWITWKKYRKYFPYVAFGIGYFVVNVMFVLQFLSVGAAIMADRYSYVAYFGLFFLLAFLFNEIRKQIPALRVAVLIVLLAASAGLAYGCYQRTFVWHDSETLLSDAIEKYPMRAQLSYKWRGNYYFDQGDFDKALEDYGVLVTLHSADAKVYDRVAVIYGLRKDYKKALETFDKSIAVQNNVYKTYVDRAMIYVLMGDTLNAFKDYVTGLQLNAGRAEQVLADTSFNYVQRQKFAPAILQYNMLIKINPNNSFYYFYRGVSLYSLGYTDAAINDWERSVKFDVADTRKAASNNLSVAYDNIGKDSLALYYVQMTVATGNTVKPDFIESIKQKAKEQSSKR